MWTVSGDNQSSFPTFAPLHSECLCFVFLFDINFEIISNSIMSIWPNIFDFYFNQYFKYPAEYAPECETQCRGRRLHHRLPYMAYGSIDKLYTANQIARNTIRDGTEYVIRWRDRYACVICVSTMWFNAIKCMINCMGNSHSVCPGIWTKFQLFRVSKQNNLQPVILGVDWRIIIDSDCLRTYFGVIWSWKIRYANFQTIPKQLVDRPVLGVMLALVEKFSKCNVLKNTFISFPLHIYLSFWTL